MHKVWLVTGASTGFGLELAREIIARGDSVVATARNLASVAYLAGEHVLPLALDVTQPDQITACVAAAQARFGRIDVLINNAGYGFLGGVEESSDAEIRAQFEVNFFGLAAMTRAVLPLMRGQRSGCVVNITSIAGVFGISGSGYYSATKFAVEGFSEALAKEMAPFGVGVLLVEPGPFRTEFFGRSMAGPANPIPEYTNTLATRENGAKADGHQPGDPVKGAKAIIDAVCMENRPLRLVLGAGAYARISAALAARLEDIAVLREVALSVDYPA